MKLRRSPILGILCLAALLASGTISGMAQSADSLTLSTRRCPRVPFSRMLKAADAVHLPQSVDNSLLPYFPPVFTQTGGSCAFASSIGYMFTYEWNRLHGTDASASKDNRFSYLFAWNLLNEGIDQGNIVTEALSVPMRYGVMSDAEYGTSGMYQFRWASGYDRYLGAMQRRVRTIYSMEDDIDLMRRYLYDKGHTGEAGGLLTFSGMSTGWTILTDYQGPSLTGYSSLLTQLASDGSHAMTIVGYDDVVCYIDTAGVTHTGAFIVVNSWGSDWQDRGRFYLPYDFFRDPTVASAQLSHTVEGIDVGEYQPQLVVRLGLNYSSRDDLYYRTARTESASVRPVFERDYPAFHCWGGDHPMQGQYLSPTIEMAIDLTDQADSSSTYWLDIVRGFRGSRMGEGTITSLALIDYRHGAPQVYPYGGSLPASLQLGRNLFALSLSRWLHLSAARHRYRTAPGELCTDSTYIVGLADGSRAKVQFLSADTAAHTLTLTYQL